MPPGETLDLGWVVADAAGAERYWLGAGVSPSPRLELPLGLALALRGGPLPAVELAQDTVSVHAGHSITLHRPFLAGRYRVRTRIAEVFEKSGRSGRLSVIVRTAELCDASAEAVVSIREQQIARWQVARPVRPSAHETVAAGGQAVEPLDDGLDIGATVAFERRRAPGAALIGAYAGALGDPEPLFADRDFAHRIGFADIIVPGPIQSALFERLLTESLPAWRLTELSLSFRVSVIVDEPIALRAMVVELAPDHDRLVADLTLENSHGEVAAAGTATLVASTSA